MEREEHLLEEGPIERFKGATLQIKNEQTSRSPSSYGNAYYLLIFKPIFEVEFFHWCCI